MKFLCACGLRYAIRMVLLLLTVQLFGTMMRAQTATATSLAVSPSSPLAAQTVMTLTATVTASGAAVHPGLVTFCDATAPPCVGLAVVGTAQLTSAGTALLRFIPAIGSHSYIAIFAGTTAYADRKSTRLNSSHSRRSRMPSSA